MATAAGSAPEYEDLAERVKTWGTELGFQQVGITNTDLRMDEDYLAAWLARGHHGDMEYMVRHGTKRTRPAELVPNTLRIISARMNYYPDCVDPNRVLADPQLAYVSRYALGRDYHKLLRGRLEQLARKIRAAARDLNYRVFTDSAPVMEKALARNAGLGWIGKNTNLIHRYAGSWFFLGEIYTDLPLPQDPGKDKNLCGTCTACLSVCPTNAFTGPYQLDARRCVSYLTIEYAGVIPENLRSLIGNRIFGCDDCQLVCPWNRYAQRSCEQDFAPRHNLDAPPLLELFSWTPEDFASRTLGSPIRRIGHARWQRNIAVALGNSGYATEILQALRAAKASATPLLAEHVDWAIARQLARSKAPRDQAGEI